MTYRTTCTHCASVFRLDTDQLDAAQGWVQCSVCGSAFNAYTHLLMADGSPLPPVEELPPPEPPAAEPEPISSPSAPVPEPEAAVADEPEHTEAPAPADMPQGIVQREASLDLPSIILIDPDAALPDEPEELPPITPESTYPGAPAAPALAADAMPVAQTAPVARIEYAAPQPGTARIPQPVRRARTGIWIGASFLLLLTLLAQSAYFLRDVIVSQLPPTRPAFEQMCQLAGCSLSLPQNLARLQIVGSDLQTEAPGRLRLAITLGNRASQVQAWPVLVLTLTDQRNRPLARRSFAPSEYLADPRRIATGMPPRSEQDLTLPLTVRGPAPMGFDLKLTY